LAGGPPKAARAQASTTSTASLQSTIAINEAFASGGQTVTVTRGVANSFGANVVAAEFGDLTSTVGIAELSATLSATPTGSYGVVLLKAGTQEAHIFNFINLEGGVTFIDATGTGGHVMGSFNVAPSVTDISYAVTGRIT
jgi:hypothetical protein